MKIVELNVVPTLPKRLKPLQELAENVWFAWNLDALKLFQSMNRDLWEETGHNPVKMLGLLDQAKVDELLEDEGFLDQMDRVHRAFQRYMEAAQSYSYNLDRPVDFKIAYLSAEYGLTECLPLYSGGLGILSGDHLKSASDLRIPLVAVGLLYKEGYFRQYLSPEGWQMERYPNNDFHNMPIEQLFDEHGAPMATDVQIEGRHVTIHIWKVQVGRVPLYLLDTNVPGNAPSDREITDKLYGGDREKRLQQEIVLGIGGVRALGRIGLRPAVFHMNEGHSAFATMERMRQLVKKGLSLDAAEEFVRASSVFTTHTPVPAGNDAFAPELIQKYFAPFVEEFGMGMARLLAYGRMDPSDRTEPFCMTVLAIKLAAWCNAVSELHATVSRKMWEKLWPDVPADESPISGLTNGVHIPSWISTEMGTLYDRYLGPRWSEDPDNQKVWEKVVNIPDTELWRTHERRRERLVAFARRRLVAQLQRIGAPVAEIESARGILNPSALTIGFARRFATYKRGSLVFHQLDRLARILNDTQRPVQIIFAGKAHPADTNGKEFIKKIVQIERNPQFRNRIVFLEDYDISVARYLVQGVDVWLNNPRRPLEACGTSGMKAAANGALNLSVLDGWWVEAYTPENGWAIGRGEEYTDEKYADDVESHAIYELLEKEIVPLYYNRGADGLPRGWIEKMRGCLRTVCPVFNTHRMVEDYMEKFYLRAADVSIRLKESSYAGAKTLADWKRHMAASWQQLQIRGVETAATGDVPVNGKVKVQALVQLNGLNPKELMVEAYYGRVIGDGEIQKSGTIAMAPIGERDGATVFAADVPCTETGRYGVAVRVVPRHDLLVVPLHSGIVKWS